LESPVPRPVILVVDDDDAIRTILADVLRDEGYIVHLARNGRDALIAVETVSIAVLVVDLHMPVMDGWELVRTLKDRGFTIPTVIITAGRDIAKVTTELAIAACLEKPFDVERLLATVATVLQGVVSSATNDVP